MLTAPLFRYLWTMVSLLHFLTPAIPNICIAGRRGGGVLVDQ